MLSSSCGTQCPYNYCIHNSYAEGFFPVCRPLGGPVGRLSFRPALPVVEYTSSKRFEATAMASDADRLFVAAKAALMDVRRMMPRVSCKAVVIFAGKARTVRCMASYNRYSWTTYMCAQTHTQRRP